ncbi:MAG TPA: tetratricopeptide repeat protein [Candidatus Acidoferrales bacterium]|nr:tetratricopeptide repeat protein [Candidatus Acidoferrales bacterium]
MRWIRSLLLMAGLSPLCFFLGAPQLGGKSSIRVPVSALHPAQLGKVNFPTSCSSAAAPTMEKGVALLHSFQYQQSEQTFTEAAQQDPHCAMAYWGKAMALYHQLWDFPDANDLRQGREDLEEARKISNISDRESEYISAAAAFFQDNSDISHAARTEAYSTAMEKLYRDNPKDTDAAAFYALSLVALAERGQHDLANRKKALAVLNPLLVSEPQHPGVAHYIIHASDTPELASEGLIAARMYAKIAPDSSHAIHMPSHIFTRLGLWQESIDSNIAAAASAAKATELRLAESHYQTHAMDFLDYAYLQSGQEAKAHSLVNDLTTIPGANHWTVGDMQATLEARNAMELHHWKEAADLEVRHIPVRDQGTTFWAKAIGAARTDDAEGAKQDLQKLIEANDAQDLYDKSMGNKVSSGEGVQRLEAEAWLAYAENKSADALKSMRLAIEREESEHLESLAMPAREMLGDLLLELKQPSEALSAYQSALKTSPKRFDSLYGAARAAESAGDPKEAREYYSQLAKIVGPGADRPELQEVKVNLAEK